MPGDAPASSAARPGGFDLAWDCRCTTAESPVWDAARGRLLFADIPAASILSHDPRTGEGAVWRLADPAAGEVVASFGLCRSGRIVAAMRRRVVLFHPDTQAVTSLTTDLDLPATVRLNDGKVGPDGAFWVGGMDESEDKQPVAALFRVTPDGRAERRLDGLVESNGLAWAPGGRTMYLSDSKGPWVDAWDFDPATGAMANRRRLITLDAQAGRPDGGACDAEGHYWSAGASAGCLNRISPRGALVARIPFPVPAPTMPCFAGDSLAVVYVGSRRNDLDPATLARHPTLGGLFRRPAPVLGSPVGLFADR